MLGSADTIAAEDTRGDRRAAAALRHRDAPDVARTSTTRRRARRASSKRCGAGRSVALVSDAGTPAISDPGARLVRAVRDAGFAVVPIPGACAAIAAVSAAGLAAERLAVPGFPALSGESAARIARARRARARGARHLRGAHRCSRHRGRARRGARRRAHGSSSRARSRRNSRRSPVTTLAAGAELVRAPMPNRDARRIRAARRRACCGGRQRSKDRRSTLAGC